MPSEKFIVSLFFFLTFLQPVYLKGEKYLLKGQIIVDSSAVQLPKDFVVDIINDDIGAIDSTTATLLATGDGDRTAATYEYSMWAKVGDKITFVPRDFRSIYLMFNLLESAFAASLYQIANVNSFSLYSISSCDIFLSMTLLPALIQQFFTIIFMIFHLQCHSCLVTFGR